MKTKTLLLSALIAGTIFTMSCQTMKTHGATAFSTAKAEYDKCVAEKSEKECQQKKEIMDRAKAKFTP